MTKAQTAERLRSLSDAALLEEMEAERVSAVTDHHFLRAATEELRRRAQAAHDRTEHGSGRAQSGHGAEQRG